MWCQYRAAHQERARRAAGRRARPMAHDFGGQEALAHMQALQWMMEEMGKGRRWEKKERVESYYIEIVLYLYIRNPN